MKKRFLIAMVAIVPLLTACGSSGNTLNCKAQHEETTREIIIEFDSKKEKVTGAVIKYSVDLKGIDDLSEFGCDTVEECLDLFASEVEECEESSDYTDCKITNRTKTGLTIEGRLTQKAAEQEFLDKNYDDVKKILEEEERYTCK